MTARTVPGDPPGVLVVLSLLTAAVTGALVGAVVRWLLRRLRRATQVGRGACELGIVLAWLPVAVADATGAMAPAWAPLWLGTGVLAVAGTATDVVDRRLPDALTVTAFPGMLACCVPLGVDAVGRAALGALLLLTGYAVVAVALPGALGGGDVKLAPSMGAALAAGSWWAVAAGPVLAALGVLGTAMICHRRAVPFGPSALASTWMLVGLAAITDGRPP